MGACGQAAHLVGDHGETAALFSGAGGFDGGVQGQEVGLLGDAFDDIDHRSDAFALLLDLLNRLFRLLHLLGQRIDGVGTLLNQFAPASGLAVRRFGGLLGGGCVFRHIGNAGGHLIHRRGDLFGLLLLLQDAVDDLLGVVRGLGHRRDHRFGGMCGALDEMTNLADELIERIGQAAQFAAAAVVEGDHQVTFAAGYVLHGVRGQKNGVADGARNQPADQQSGRKANGQQTDHQLMGGHGPIDQGFAGVCDG